MSFSNSFFGVLDQFNNCKRVHTSYVLVRIHTSYIWMNNALKRITHCSKEAYWQVFVHLKRIKFLLKVHLMCSIPSSSFSKLISVKFLNIHWWLIVTLIITMIVCSYWSGLHVSISWHHLSLPFLPIPLIRLCSITKDEIIESPPIHLYSS